MKNVSHILIILFSALVTVGLFGTPQKYRIDFTIHHPKTDKLFFKGFEDVVQNGSSVNKKAYYYDLKETLLQTEFVTFDASNLQILDYDYTNKVTGEMSQLRSSGKKIDIVYRSSEKEEKKTGSVEWEENMFHGKTFHRLIMRNFPQLSQGKDIDFKLFIPYRFETLDFKIVRTAFKEVSGKKHFTFALQPDNFFIRQFAPKLEADYIVEEKPRIVSFYGPTTLPIDGKKGEMVRVRFKY